MLMNQLLLDFKADITSPPLINVKSSLGNII